MRSAVRHDDGWLGPVHGAAAHEDSLERQRRAHRGCHLRAVWVLQVIRMPPSVSLPETGSAYSKQARTYRSAGGAGSRHLAAASEAMLCAPKAGQHCK